MKNWKILLPIALLLSTFWFACRDQDGDDFEQMVEVAFAGRILDEDGQPIADASVRVGGELAITDANGVFRTKSTRLPARDAKISVNKIGYFDFSRAYIVENNALQTVTIQLLRKQLVGTFSGNTGGTVSVPGGASLVFPAGAVSHSGQVRVFARWLDPASSDLAFQMPGDLRAITTGGEEQTLATFGMIGVEITDQNGQELSIASGSEVEITMPIPANQIAVAPASIPLWHYDHDKARWIEEGSAQKIGSQYVGKVKHFSFWNCDIPLPLVQISGKVLIGPDQVPVANAHVVFSYTTYLGKCHGWTDASGCFAGSAPKDVELLLEIFVDGCSIAVYSETVGPFPGDIVLPPIVIDDTQLQTASVSGKLVECDGQPVENGYAKVEIGGTSHTVFTDANGDFEINFVNCAGIVSGTAIGYDLANLLESAPQNFNITSGVADLGSIQVCTMLSEFIQYTLDGQNFTMVDVSGALANSAPGNTQVFLNSLDSLQSTGIAIVFGNNNNQLGTFPMLAFFVNGLETLSDQAANVSTTLTNTGDVGEPFIGTFGGSFQAVNGTNHTISGSYRVIRDQ